MSGVLDSKEGEEAVQDGDKSDGVVLLGEEGTDLEGLEVEDPAPLSQFSLLLDSSRISLIRFAILSNISFSARSAAF